MEIKNVYLSTSVFSFKRNDKKMLFFGTILFSEKAGKNMLFIIASANQTSARNTLIIITEKVTKSLRQWCKGKKLFTKAANNVVTPSDSKFVL